MGLCQLEDDKTLLISRARALFPRLDKPDVSLFLSRFFVLYFASSKPGWRRRWRRRWVVDNNLVATPDNDRTFPKSGELIFHFPGIPGVLQKGRKPVANSLFYGRAGLELEECARRDSGSNAKKRSPIYWKLIVISISRFTSI